MEQRGDNFLDIAMEVVKEEVASAVPLVEFKQPKVLESILNLDVSNGVDDKELERCVREVLKYCVKTNKATFRNQLYGATDPYGLSGAWIAEAFNTSQYVYIFKCDSPVCIPRWQAPIQFLGSSIVGDYSVLIRSNLLPRGQITHICMPFPPWKTKQFWPLHRDVKSLVTFRRDLDGAGSNVTKRYTYEVAPAFTLIELKMLNHILKLFGIPDGDGIFSPGGSISMLYAMVAARYKAFPQVKSMGMRNLPELVVFTSEDSHYSIMKGAHWLGFGTDSVKRIETNEHGQMCLDALEAAIKNEKELGNYPVMVNATAGTTVLGAIDNLEGVADVCAKHGVWMHVDACWGGSLMLSRKYRHKLRGIERANSISWNPHKMAGAPLQCSVFLIRERGLLHAANCASAEYLFQQDKFYDVSYDTGDKSVQCGRKIDAFKLWMIWKARGDEGLCQLADHVMEIAQFCLENVAQRPGFRLVAHTLQCPNLCFWYIPKFMREKAEDAEWWESIHKITKKIKELAMLSSRLMISYTPLRQHKNFFRLAFTFHPVLEEADVLDMLQTIEDCGEKVTPDML